MGLHSCYLQDVLSDVKVFRKTVSKVVKVIKEQNIEYDYLIGTGLSGTIIVPVLALRLNKQFCILRKNLENSHGDYYLEGNPDKRVKYIFVDDFISLGNTINDCIKAMKNTNTRSKCVGCMLYHRDYFGFQNIKSIKNEHGNIIKL